MRVEIYRSDPPRRRECLYYLSLGHYKMGNYDEARRFNGRSPYPRFLQLALSTINWITEYLAPFCWCMITAVLIEREPNNLQAQSLNQLIEKGVARGKSYPSHQQPLSESEDARGIIEADLTLFCAGRGTDHRGILGNGVDRRSSRSSKYCCRWIDASRTSLDSL